MSHTCLHTRRRWWVPTRARVVALAAAVACSLGAVQVARRLAAGPPVVPAPIAPASAAAAAHPEPAEPAFVVIWGRYVNYVYGYSVDIPEELFALTTAPPMPQHGCSVDLDVADAASYGEVWRKEGLRREVWMDGSYNAAMEPSLEVLVDQRLRWRAEEFDGVRVVRREWSRLGPLRALRVVATMSDRATSTRVVEEWLVAGWRAPESTSVDDVHYTVGLITTAERYEDDRRAFEQMVRSFRLR